MFVSYLKQLVLAPVEQNRRMGSRYIGMQLKSMGYDVEYQPFQVPDQYVGFIESPLSTKRNWQAGAALMHSFLQKLLQPPYLCSRWDKIRRYSK